MLVVKIFMHSLPHRSKCATVLGMSRHLVSYALIKWAPLWATFGSCMSALPMSHGFYKKEFSNEHIEYDLKNGSHLVDGKEMLIEKIRVNDSLKRRSRSEKVHEYAARTLNFSTPMGLSFEYARALGA